MNLFDAPPSYAAPPTGDGTVSFTGTVKAVRCYKEESGWAAVTIETDGGTVSATGIMRGVREGMTAELAGRFDQTRFGTTLRASSFVERLPSDIPGIEKYLASGLIKNIGPVLARQITQTFGERTLDVLDNEPERLCEVHGIGAKRLASLVESLREQKAMRGIMIWLKRYGISNAMAAKIYKTWGDESLAKLEENPYRLADDINGVGFHKADEVATSLGIPHDSTFRIRSGLKACLEEAAANGNTCMPQEALVETAAGMLALDEKLVDTVMKKDSAGTVKTDDTMAYLPRYLKAEKGITDKIVLLASAPTPAFTPDFGSLKEATGLDYSQEQRDAVLRAATSGVLVITGGPGTGKTATTNAIIRTFEQQDRKVLLAAPTGRAAKRMEEVTGRHAKTIHRLLEFSYEGFARNGDYPLEGDALIVDESSMIDTLLMDHLLKAVPAGMKLILVGDVDQLPSVGAGSVLRDIIDSGAVPTVRLTQIYRQAQGSAIIMGAHEVNRGLPPRITNAQGTDLWLFRAEERETVADLTIDLVRNRIPAKFGIPPEDIQVLTPTRRDWDPIGLSLIHI